MPAPYSSVAIANSFLKQFGKQGGIEHMKLQKLTYCAYGWWLAEKGIEGVRLTNDGPEIWKHGPVFFDMYHTFRVFGRHRIEEPQSSSPFVEPELVGRDDTHINNLIKWIWKRYGHLSSFALSDMTHKVGTPWQITAEQFNYRIERNTPISDKLIYSEFKAIRDREFPSSQNRQTA